MLSGKYNKLKFQRGGEMKWKCKKCGESYFEDCSPYYAVCLSCGNEGKNMEDIASEED